MFRNILKISKFNLHSSQKINDPSKHKDNKYACYYCVLQAWSGRREANMGYTQLAVQVEPSEDADANDATELMT